MKWFIYILAFSSFQLCAQSNLNPFLKISYFQVYTDHLGLNELELGAGVQFNDYISAQINIRGAQDPIFKDPLGKFQVATFSIEPSYRILGKKYMFSPVIAYDAGIEIANNGKEKFIYMSNYVYFPYYESSRHKLNKGLYYGKAKVLLSIQWKQLDFLIGATYNTYFFRFYELEPDGPQTYPASAENKYKIVGTFTDGEFGFGFETSIKYTFPMKKQQAKKAAE